MRKIVAILGFILTIGCRDKNANPVVAIETKFGDIEIELYPAKAPKTVAAFLSYVDAGLYKKSSFYRILNMDNQPINAPKSELIQGGIWQSNNAKSNDFPGIPHESTQQTGIMHTNGTISLARREPGTASTEFFICIGDQPGLDFGGKNNPDGQGYAAFGRVIKGMDVVRKIYRQAEYEQAFDPPVVIFDITRL